MYKSKVVSGKDLKVGDKVWAFSSKNMDKDDNVLFEVIAIENGYLRMKFIRGDVSVFTKNQETQLYGFQVNEDSPPWDLYCEGEY